LWLFLLNYTSPTVFSNANKKYSINRSYPELKLMNIPITPTSSNRGIFSQFLKKSPPGTPSSSMKDNSKRRSMIELKFPDDVTIQEDDVQQPNSKRIKITTINEGGDLNLQISNETEIIGGNGDVPQTENNQQSDSIPVTTPIASNSESDSESSSDSLSNFSELSALSSLFALDDSCFYDSSLSDSEPSFSSHGSPDKGNDYPFTGREEELLDIIESQKKQIEELKLIVKSLQDVQKK
jgi:hypothetical protein